MLGFTLDTGALIALERKDERMKALLARVLAHPEAMIHIPAGVVAQAFRDGSKQVRLVRLLKETQARVVALDEDTARAVGILLGLRGANDVIDASVVMCARRYDQPVVTADPDDLRRLDASIELHAI
ncbi:MAG TPA: PIN domain-containing protein [Solirubrobacteraceae bacterium]|nr:PIN domain-containing protein [Solirubrobacteraceae bacterium]